MGFFSNLFGVNEKTASRKAEAQAHFRGYPGGFEQFDADSRKLLSLLQEPLSAHESRLVLCAIYNLFITPYGSYTKSFDDCRPERLVEVGAKLSVPSAYLAYSFLCAKFGIRPTRLSPACGTTKENPLIIRKPTVEVLQKLRLQFRVGEFKEYTDSRLDNFIAVQIQNLVVSEHFGEQGTDWKNGLRMYWEKVKSQEVVFLNGKPSTTLYFDFSEFGS